MKASEWKYCSSCWRVWRSVGRHFETVPHVSALILPPLLFNPLICPECATDRTAERWRLQCLREQQEAIRGMHLDRHPRWLDDEKDLAW